MYAWQYQEAFVPRLCTDFTHLSLSLCQGKQVQLRSNHALDKEASSIIINGQRILCWVNDRAGRLLGSALTGQEWSIWVRFNLQRGCRIIRRTFRNGIPRIESNKVAAAIKKIIKKKGTRPPAIPTVIFACWLIARSEASRPCTVNRNECWQPRWTTIKFICKYLSFRHPVARS